ncbi:MAG: hypothetical protein J5741_05605 [Bacteroidales bacterium]|nr:hypothetical protein [Bacteroidales bacterium]
MIHYDDYVIECIEQEIIQTYYDGKIDYTEHQNLLTLRKVLLNRQALMHQQDLLPDIIAFNEALREALSEMYETARRIYRDTLSCDYGEHLEVTARCYLSGNYPPLHPLQNDSRDELWCALRDSGYNPLYEDGVSLSTLTLPSDFRESFDDFIGMTCPPPNWNEGLDPELTKDLHLISAFHHLFDHTHFALTDFIFVRDFRTEITMEVVTGE